MINGFMAGVGGVILASRLRSVSTGSGGGDLLLSVIAAAVIGGTSLFGGRGRVITALLGGLVIASINNGMGLLQLPQGNKSVITGLVLLAAVLVDALAKRRRAAAAWCDARTQRGGETRMTYEPTSEHRFTFGLWTVGNPGRDPFGEPDARRALARPDRRAARPKSARTASTSTTTTWSRSTRRPPSATAIEAEFKKALERHRPGRADGDDEPLQRPGVQGRRVHRATIRRSAPTRCRRRCAAMDLGVELGAKTYVFWGGREGARATPTKNPVDAIKRFREAIELPVRVRDRPEVRAASSRSRPSRTSRAATSICRRPELSGVHPDARSSGHGAA